MKRSESQYPVLRGILYVLLVFFIVACVLCVALYGMFSVKGVKRQLEKNGFYEIAEQTLLNRVEEWQSVVPVQPKAVLDTITPAVWKQAVEQYATELATHFLQGGAVPKAEVPQSDAVYQLICKALPDEVYKEIPQMAEIDRQAAFSDLSTAITGALDFFPSTLLTAIEKSGVPFNTIHLVVKWATRLIPVFGFFVILIAGLLMVSEKNTVTALRKIGGIGSVTSAVLFFPVVFINLPSFFEKFGLAEGCLRQFLSAVLQQGVQGILTPAGVCMVAGFLLYVICVIITAVKQTNTCADEKSVIK